jgi:hypothetical protein
MHAHSTRLSGSGDHPLLNADSKSRGNAPPPYNHEEWNVRPCYLNLEFLAEGGSGVVAYADVDLAAVASGGENGDVGNVTEPVQRTLTRSVSASASNCNNGNDGTVRVF